MENPSCANNKGNRMKSLKEVIETGKLGQFIKQNEQPKGNKAAFDATILSMAGKSKPIQKTSSVDDHDD